MERVEIKWGEFTARVLDYSDFQPNLQLRGYGQRATKNAHKCYQKLIKTYRKSNTTLAKEERRRLWKEIWGE